MELDAGGAPRRCGASTREGGRCQHEAGWGTDHPGWGRCKFHGGNSRNGRLHAARLEALASMPAFGADVDIEAIDALLFCIKREAGRQVWLRLRLQLIDPEGVEAIADPAGVHAELHRLEMLATERLARFSKMALDAGVAERRIRLVERQAQALAHPGPALDGGAAVEPGPGGVRAALRGAASPARSGAAGRRGPGPRGRVERTADSSVRAGAVDPTASSRAGRALPAD